MAPVSLLDQEPLLHPGRFNFADAVYYTTPSGAGVFESGTHDWVCGMDPYCTGPAQAGHFAPILDAISTRLFTTFSAGPAGRAHPAADNLAKLNIRAGTHQAAAPDIDWRWEPLGSAPWPRAGPRSRRCSSPPRRGTGPDQRAGASAAFSRHGSAVARPVPRAARTGRRPGGGSRSRCRPRP